VDLGRGVILSLPIIPANMKTIQGPAMADLMIAMGGLALLHRFNTIEEQVALFLERKEHALLVGASVGVTPKEYERAKALIAAGCRIICVDVAHGDHELALAMVRHLRVREDILIIAGNVATADGALRLAKAGADVIKVGVGPGSLCTTRIETGNGVPQLTAIAHVHDAREQSGASFRIIADGGIRNAGDIVKALCFSEAVMVGNLLAGTQEAPGELTMVDGRSMRRYEGSSTHKTNHVEGVVTLVPEKGSAKHLIDRLMEGVRSGCSYQGAHSIIDLQRDPVFVRISHAGLTESHPHLIAR
jgi:IMP dehydrogenase